MKKLLLPTFSLFALGLLLTSSTGGRTDGRSGSPGDGASCSGCHGASSAQANMITTDIPSSGYIAGTTYNISVTVAEAGRSVFGFQITAENGSSNKVGTFSTGGNTNVQTNTANTLVTHKSTGTAGTDSKTWAFEWTAPSAAGDGDITFYVAGNAANDDGGTGGDIIYVSSKTETEGNTNVGIDEVATSTIQLYPNPVQSVMKLNTMAKVIEIYNIAGQLIKAETNVSSINMADFEKGLYIVEVTSQNNESSTHKIVKN